MFCFCFNLLAVSVPTLFINKVVFEDGIIPEISLQ